MVMNKETAKVDSAFGFNEKNLPDMTPDPKTGKSKYEGFEGFPISYEYEYPVFGSEAEALAGGYNFVALANTAAKNKAKSNAYQSAISVLKPDVNDPTEVRKRMLKDLIALGKTPAQAEALLESLTQP